MIQYLCNRLKNACVFSALGDNLRARGTQVDLIDWLVFIWVKLLFQRSVNEPTRITLIPLIVTLIVKRHGFHPIITVPPDTREFLTLSTTGLENWLVRRSWRRVKELKRWRDFNTDYPQIYCLWGSRHAFYDRGYRGGGKLAMTIFLEEIKHDNG